MINKKAITIGAAAGLVLAAADVGLIWLNRGSNPALEEITNFLGALPVFLFWASSIPEVASIMLFFIYWAVVGATLAALALRGRMVFTVAALLLIVLLGISHRAAQLVLNKEMEEAARAHGHGAAAKPQHP
ncbi:MAG TPA: hypothetical protein VL754_18170 [Verrucomicrobiae bacterium]|nr:hypothetical protein [Verrucomicrobiae bacterium]